MKRIYIFGTLAVFFSLLFVSCSKYEEGSYFTLIPKKMRICADWELREVEDSTGNNYNLSDINVYLKINRDETCEYREIKYSFGAVISDETYKGIWKFIDKKKTMSIYFPSNQVQWKCPIIQLTSSNLKIKLNSDYLTFFTYDLL